MYTNMKNSFKDLSNQLVKEGFNFQGMIKYLKWEFSNIIQCIKDTLTYQSRKRKISRITKEIEDMLWDLRKTDERIVMENGKRANGLFNTNGTITMYTGLKYDHYFQVLIHEIAHMMHFSMDDNYKYLSCAELELIAEATSFVVCDFYGISNKKSSVSYIKHYDVNEAMIKKYESIIIHISKEIAQAIK
ncbi:hypothetical protein ACU82A_32285 [Bacillus cereus]